MAADPVKALGTASSEVRSFDARMTQSSHVRTRASDLESRAARRVSEYLRTLGVSDAERVHVLAQAIAAETETDDAESHAHRAVSLAQERFETWRKQVFAGLEREPEPLWLRGFVAAHPELFLTEPELARAAMKQFGDPEAGQGPIRARFAEQTLEPVRVPRWLRGLSPALVTTGAASLALLIALGGDGLGALELAWVGLFSFLFGLSAIGFFTAAFGFFRRSPAVPPPSTSQEPLPRSAVIMPVYHESAEHVFAAIAAMRESIRACPGASSFEIFVLSDSRDPALAAEEERAFRRITSGADDKIPIYYRRRVHNTRSKAGNVAEFFERWGHRYEYVVLLDADSVMRGNTIVELVRRLHASPRVALLQAPIALTGGDTLFARALQFAGSLCGPIFTRGLSYWSGPHGNYYGHNAAIRVKAFLECCSLPALDGDPPFGGYIMSHDFVEAALLCRAGWEVRMADDLDGSYEGLPPTLPEYVARDRRWCQGNFQHLRVAVARGLRPMSRIHLLLGVGAYLAGPAWLLFPLLGLGLVGTANPLYLDVGIAIMGCTGVMLLGPRILGFLWNLKHRDLRRAHGGVIRLTLGTLFELVLAAALAPLLMLHHARIVISILVGRAVGWGAQRRRSNTGFMSIVRTESSTMLFGVALAAALWQWAPSLLVWLAPVWVPWVLAIPIAAIASSEWAGQLARRLGLLMVPSETEPDPVLNVVEELCPLTSRDQAARFRDLVLDPVLLSTHLARVAKSAKEAKRTKSAPSSRDEAVARIAELRQRALRVGPAALSEPEREALSQDTESMKWLHREAWRHWPVESWQVARDRPQTPPESRLSLA